MTDSERAVDVSCEIKKEKCWREKGKNFFGCRYVVDIDLVRDEKSVVAREGK